MEITKEQALEIAKFNDDTIHCFINAPMGLIGANHTKGSFLNRLEQAEKIEIGVNVCRKMEHALVLWLGGIPFFFEHDEYKLKKLIRTLNGKSKRI